MRHVISFPTADAAKKRGQAVVIDFGASGNFAAARDLWRAIADAREHNLGPEHPDTLGAKNDLANMTGEAGDADPLWHVGGLSPNRLIGLP